MSAAWECALTQREWRRRVRSAFVLATLGLLLLLGFVGAVGFFADQSDQLRASGTRTSGSVIGRDEDSRTSSGGVVVSYRVGQRRLSERVELGGDVTSYHLGQQVTVYYDPRRPTLMTIDDEDNQPSWTVLPMIVALLASIAFLVGGGAALARWWRVRRLLRSDAWHPVLTHVTLDRRNRVVVTADLPAGPIALRLPLLTGTHLAQRSSTPHSGPDELWLAGPGRRLAVLAQPGGAPMWCARAPRTTRAAARWQRSARA